MNSLGYRSLIKLPNPINISGLRGWYKEEVTLVSGEVSVWLDQSGFGNNATALLAANRPSRTNTIKGKPVLTFDGSSDYLSAPGLVTFYNGNDTPNTVIVAIKPATITPLTNVVIINGGQNSTNYYYSYGLSSTSFIISSRREVFPTQVDVTSSPNTYTTAMQIISFVFTGTFLSIYLNGTLVVSASQNLPTFATQINRVGIGAFYRNTVTNYFNGDMAELLFFNNALSNSERENMEYYLKTRWV